jgi:hypothetical protein
MKAVHELKGQAEYLRAEHYKKINNDPGLAIESDKSLLKKR